MVPLVRGSLDGRYEKIEALPDAHEIWDNLTRLKVTIS
jgi:hypothetical protein